MKNRQLKTNKYLFFGVYFVTLWKDYCEHDQGILLFLNPPHTSIYIYIHLYTSIEREKEEQKWFI